ncbi:MAG: glycosyltransferase family 4 protein [Armatimonadota bacterium]
MKITFLLPGPARKPMGGYRVAYEYADRLAGRGHRVCVVHDLNVPYLDYRKPYALRYIGHWLTNGHIPRWFSFKNRVELKLVSHASDRYMPDADAVIATWWGTAYSVSKLSAAKGKKFYLIQEYVMRGNDESLVHESYALGLANIVIAGWIKRAVEQAGGSVCALIPNGIDTDFFRIKTPIESRDPHSVTMMYHEAAFKGSKEAIEALKIVRSAIPGLKVTEFSVFNQPNWMPEWIDFVHNPSQEVLVDIYNSHAVFVNASTSEGWGLPSAESAACGCALVSTDVGWVSDYASDKEIVLVSPSDAPSLAENILKLVQDNDFRVRLANQGHDFIGNFSWDKAVDALETVLSGDRPR